MTSMDASRGATWGVGSTIETSASILFKNFVPFVGTALIASLPGLIFAQIVSSNAAQTIVNLVISQIVTVTLIYGAMQALRQRQIAIMECLEQGFRRLGAALGVAIIAAICIGVGLVALVVPGLIVMTIWAVAIPAATIEQVGVGAALSRSAALTRERRWRVFGAMLVTMIIGIVVAMIAASIAGVIAGGHSFLFTAVIWALSAVSQAFSACVSTTLYYFLRREKEGVEIDQIATVFD
jgi:hypothetical protein